MIDIVWIAWRLWSWTMSWIWLACVTLWFLWQARFESWEIRMMTSSLLDAIFRCGSANPSLIRRPLSSPKHTIDNLLIMILHPVGRVFSTTGNTWCQFQHLLAIEAKPLRFEEILLRLSGRMLAGDVDVSLRGVFGEKKVQKMGSNLEKLQWRGHNCNLYCNLWTNQQVERALSDPN